MVWELMFLITPVLLAGLTFIVILKSSKSSFGNFPVDFGLNFRGRRIFGKNKTFRGFLIMGSATAIYGCLTYIILSRISGFRPDLPPGVILFKFLLIGLLYSLGELPNSFIKRRFSVEPGTIHRHRIPAALFKISDTFDSITAVGLGYIFLFGANPGMVIKAILIGGILHLLTDRLMLHLGLKQNQKCES
jgi:hypothetical protein